MSVLACCATQQLSGGNQSGEEEDGRNSSRQEVHLQPTALLLRGRSWCSEERKVLHTLWTQLQSIFISFRRPSPTPRTSCFLSPQSWGVGEIQWQPALGLNS